VIASFHFLRPYWLFMLLPLAWILWRYWRQRQQGGSWQAVCDAHLLPHLLVGKHAPASRMPIVLLGIAGVLATLALAGPVWSKLPQPVYHNNAATVVLLNLSDSMNSSDVTPSRLERAKLKLLDFLRRQREGQTALIAYAGEAYVVSPLTDDAATIESLVTSLDTTIMPVAGDHLSEALHKADALLDQDGVFKGGRVLLITDDAGDEHALKAARELEQKGRVLSVLAVGTQHGAPIRAAGGGFVQDSHGGILIPILDQAALAKLASVGHGHMEMLSTTDADLNHLWPTGETSVFKPKRAGEQHAADVWREEGPWLLVLVLPLLVLLGRQGWLGMIVLAVVLQPHPAQASTWSDLWSRPDQQAYRALQHDDANTAAKLFKNPQWRSIAQYRAGDYAAAASGFGSQHSPDALYNQGNALARSGKLAAAAQNYRKVLQQQPNNADAQHNLKIVEDLLKQQQQQKQNNSGQQNKQQGKSGQSSDKNAGQDQSASQNQQQGNGQTHSQSGQQDKAGHKQNGQGQQDQAQQQAQSSQQQQGKQNNTNPSQQQQAKSSTPQQSGKSAKATQAQPQQSQLAQQQSGEQPGQKKPPQAQASSPSTQPEEGDRTAPQSQAGASSDIKPKSETDQALAQWLRRIPDDPGGLLRRKFMLQHLQRQRAENRNGI